MLSERARESLGDAAPPAERATPDVGRYGAALGSMREAAARGDWDGIRKYRAEADAIHPCNCGTCRLQRAVLDRHFADAAKPGGGQDPPAETPAGFVERRMNESARAVAAEASEEFGIRVEVSTMTLTPDDDADRGRRIIAASGILAGAATLVGRNWPCGPQSPPPTDDLVGLEDDPAAHLDRMYEEALADDEDDDLDDRDLVVDLRHEEWREYVTPAGFTEDGEDVVMARIEGPLTLGIPRDGEIHRVLGEDGIVTMVAGPSRGNVIRYRPRDPGNPFGFRKA